VRQLIGADLTQMSKGINIKTVAERAGLSTATVARVLHNNGYVAEATREKVMRAVNETGYQINAIARSLKRSRSNVIGHLLQSTVPNPFFVKVARGVEEFAQANGYTTLTYNVQGDAEAERKGVETFLGWRVDAFIFTTPLAAENVDRALSAGVPVIQVERPRSDKGHCLTVDNASGAREAMQHLLSLGHRRIAYVGQRPGSQHNVFADYVEEERFGPYRDALQAIGAFEQNLVAFGEAYRLSDMDAHGLGYQAMNNWLDAGVRPTAVFASSDILAAGVLQAIHEHELQVPKDISVIGFDDTLAPFLAPELTTVHLPAHELGVAAAQLALDQLSGHSGNIERGQKLKTRLVLRSSTAVAAQ
jgi:DNA-binding LacI/PurR family transcriptional regulator